MPPIVRRDQLLINQENLERDFFTADLILNVVQFNAQCVADVTKTGWSI